MVKASKVRLFVDSPLSSGTIVELERDAVHYVANVMRLGVGDPLILFNGVDGEWRAEIEKTERRTCIVAIREMLRPQTREADLWIAAAPIKRARMELLVEKATELGVTRIQPVITSRTVVSRTNVDRLVAQAKEAAEQCGRLSIPSVTEPVPLSRFLESAVSPRWILWCDESGESAPVAEVLARVTVSERVGPWTLLVGPEGGFDPTERNLIGKSNSVLGIDLGPRVLRSETAAIVALGILQTWIGTH